MRGQRDRYIDPTKVLKIGIGDWCWQLLNQLEDVIATLTAKPSCSELIEWYICEPVGQGTGLRPDWVARKFNHRSALFRVQNQVTIPEKRINL